MTWEYEHTVCSASLSHHSFKNDNVDPILLQEKIYEHKTLYYLCAFHFLENPSRQQIFRSHLSDISDQEQT